MKYAALILLSLFLLGCNNQARDMTGEVGRKAYQKQRNPVGIIVLEKDTFKNQLISNGRLRAQRKSDLSFTLDASIVHLPVKNGDRVQKGSVIAQLRQFEQKQKLRSAEVSLKKARLDLKDFLIGQGYDWRDSANIPEGVMDIARIRSGYAEALQCLAQAQHDFQSTLLVAPFDGKIANLKANLHERPSMGERKSFCTLIDDSKFEVYFQVIEEELDEVRINQTVKVIPFSLEKSYTGKVTEINPLVDENGLVTVKALIKNPGELMEGMNVRVLVENPLPGHLIVPKSAVLLRQNQEVLFKYESGTAYWTYVKTLFENTDAYAVTVHPDKGGSLSPGDTVIVTGNLNLAHESEVVIK